MPRPRRSTRTTHLTRGLLGVTLAGSLGVAGVCLASTASADILGAPAGSGVGPALGTSLGTAASAATAATAPVTAAAHVGTTTPVTPVAVSLGAAAKGPQATVGTTVKAPAAGTTVRAATATSPAAGPAVRAAAAVSPAAARLSCTSASQPALVTGATASNGNVNPSPASPVAASAATGASPQDLPVDVPVDTLGQPTWSTDPAAADLQLVAMTTDAADRSRMARSSDMVVIPPTDGVLGRIATNDQTLVAVLVMGLLAATFVLAAEIRAARPHAA